MANRIIQAVAGAGKTYTITHVLPDPQKRYLFVTYTNGNVRNLKRELELSEFNPEQYEVLTFSKLCIHWMLFPFLPSMTPNIYSKFNGNFSNYEPISDARNPQYIVQTKPGHFVTKNNAMYLQRVATYIEKQESQILEQIWERISEFVDEIIIDEFQDLTGPDFKLVQKMMKQKFINVTLVGDVYQSDVSRSSKNASKYSFNTDDLEKELKKLFGARVEVDCTTLSASRRITKNTAEFVTEKIGIAIESFDGHEGIIKKVDSDSELLEILDKKPVILVWNKSVSTIKDFDTRSWSYSKGDTFENVLIVLTTEVDKVVSEKANHSILKQSTINKFYVATTRSRNDVFFVSSDQWNRVCNNFGK